MNKKKEELNSVNRLFRKSALKPNGVYCLFLIIFITGVFRGNGQKSPYPDSPVIKGISLDWSSHRRAAQGSDNFQLTWADDNNLYGSWGDGGGFVGNDNKTCRVPFGVARIEGSQKKWKGFDVWGDPNCSENGATFNGKSWGTISVEGVLYMWVVSDHKYGHLKFVNLARSYDHGASWEQSDWKFEITDRLSIPTFLNFGKDNSGAKDDFIYSYFIHVEDTTNTKFEMHEMGKLYLSRVHKDSIWEGRKVFQWFKGTNLEEAQWGGVLDKKPVFEDPEGVGWCLSAFYNQGIRRYILSAEHTETHQGIMGIFDAPEPWGPWTTVKYWTEEDYFGKYRPGDSLDWARNVFFIAFNNKWLSKSGKKFTLNFTGGGRGKDNDSFNTLKGSFIVK